jgi:glycosyltransferase involved in cell wall biosynthesis
LGQLRNIGNKECKGDITVCMDDDDYYFPTRVSHAVEKLVGSSLLIAGCTQKLMYDYSLKKMYRFGNLFGKYHSTNDSMAWKREYLINNSHDPEKDMAEEASFTKQFSQPLIQLNSKHVSISSSHSHNTFNKRQLCIQSSLGMHQNMFDDGDTLADYIPSDFLTKFRDLYPVSDKMNHYKISYYTGLTSMEWDPQDPSLGGSEQAVVHLATEWVKVGIPVAVFGMVPNKIHNGVHYYNAMSFPYELNHDTVIIWRMAGLRGIGPFKINCKNL